MEKLASAFIVAFDASVQTILVALGGAYVARMKYLSADAAADLSKVTVNFVLPCLIFTLVITALDLDRINTFFLICTFVAVQVSLGISLGHLIGKLTGSYTDLTHLMEICISHDQTTAIPLYYAEVLGSMSFTAADPDFKTQATSYVLIFSVFMVLSNWTVAYSLMQKSPAKRPLLQHTDSFTDSTEDERKAPFLKQLYNSLNPPAYAMLLALPIAIIPHVKELLFVGQDAIFKQNLFAAIGKVGGVTSVLIFIVLGATLSKGYSTNCDITRLQLTCVLAAKLVVVPAFGFGMFYGLYVWGVIDRVLAISMMICFASPTALQMFAVCTRQHNQVDNISKILLFMYLLSPIPMALLTVAALLVLY